jgi:hypothetical protein
VPLVRFWGFPQYTCPESDGESCPGIFLGLSGAPRRGRYKSSETRTGIGICLPLRAMLKLEAQFLKLIYSRKIKRSVEFLQSRRDRLVPHENIDDLIFSASEGDASWLRGIEYHLECVAGAIRKALWSNGIFIGMSVLVDLLFRVLRGPQVDEPIKQVLRVIRDSGIHKPGIVVYPLHSFGILAAGFLRYFTGAEAEMAVPGGGLLLRAQTNDLERSIAFLQSSARALCPRKRLSRDQIEHYSRSRPTQWLTLNPLLVMRVRSFSGTYYENQGFLIQRLKLATALLFMLAALQERFHPSRVSTFGSTLRINNFQTLDIKHYLLFEPRPGKSSSLEGRCIPMNVSRAELAELSTLNIEIDPRAWRRRPPLVGKLCASLTAVERGYLRHNVGHKTLTTHGRVYRKLFDSLSYFRASFRRTGNPGEQIVNLAIAFEVLLTDYYAPGVTERLCRRLPLALGKAPQKEALCESLSHLCKARNEIVHEGGRTKNQSSRQLGQLLRMHS